MATGVKNTVKADKLIHALQVKVRRLLMGLAAAIEGAYREEIRNQAGVYTGTLMGTIAGSRLPTSKGIMAVQVGTPVEHGAYYEWGTKAHGLDADGRMAIRRWVELKIQPHVVALGFKMEATGAVPTGKAKKLEGNARKRAIDQVARAIQHAIRLHGTRPHRAMANALARLGVPFVLTEEGGLKHYQIDAAAWLQKADPQLWQNIVAAAQSGGGGDSP